MIDWQQISLEDLAGYISEKLRQKGIDVILVGGGCVTIYSNNRYQSYDLDFVTYEDMSKVRKVLMGEGFKEKNRYFKHHKCPYIIEFVTPPVAIGKDPIHHFERIKTKLGTIKLLRLEDSVKDRLASFFTGTIERDLNKLWISVLREKLISMKLKSGQIMRVI
ncbi:MAG: hypothetical protein AB7N99_04885 [Simkaniaceae bacterium]|jgi:hypothetical protein